jgi:hypothetical protein
MEKAIEALQDKIIFITGQIELTKLNSQFAKDTVLRKWKSDIEELKKAQLILQKSQ